MICNTRVAAPDRKAVEPLILVQEITHRVVNEYAQAITTLVLAAADAPCPDAQGALRQAALRLQAFAEAHRVLQPLPSAGDVGLGDYLARVCAALVAASLHERGVRLRLVCDDIALSPGRCWRMGMIVAELVANSVSHGFGDGEGAILIEVRSSGGRFACRVSDNGAATSNPRRGRGSNIVEGLATELGGDVEWRFTPTGTCVLLTAPRGEPLLSVNLELSGDAGEFPKDTADATPRT
jgi:two-component sensor histidine kinase